MPAARRSPTRPGAGPGRGTRSRTSSRTGGSRPRSGRSTAEDEVTTQLVRESSDDGVLVDGGAEGTGSDRPQSVAETRRVEAARRRSSLTTRAIALAVVLLILTISYASSLRIYLSQRHEIATTEAQIAQRQTQIADLQSTLDRWNDPNYVKTQARARLGWVVPGEIGYRVIGADGKVVGTQSTGGTSTVSVATPPKAWWENLWGSVEAADAEPSGKPTPSKAPTITESTKPKG